MNEINKLSELKLKTNILNKSAGKTLFYGASIIAVADKGLNFLSAYIQTVVDYYL